MAETSTQQPSADYFISTHQFTRTVHRDRYPSIDPTSPKLSQKGQTVIVTGASQGIGKVSLPRTPPLKPSICIHTISAQLAFP